MTRLILAVVIAVSLYSSPVWAQRNDTPGSPDACRIEPCVETLQPVGGVWIGKLAQCGYVIHDLTFGSMTIPDYIAQLQVGYGWWFQNSHSNTTSYTIELFTSEVQRDAALDAYNGEPWTGYLEAGTTPAGEFTISLSAAGIQQYFRSWDTVVFNGGCLGAAYSYAWSNARSVLAYDYSVTNIEVFADTKTVMGCLLGEQGLSRRTLGSAITGTTIVCTGQRNTVTNPTIQYSSLNEGATLNRSMILTIRSDCPVRIEGRRTLACIASGGVAMASFTSIDPYTVSALVGPWTKGAGSILLRSFNPSAFQLDGLASDASGIGLDGDGKNGPSDFVLGLYSAVDNPAASLSSFTAIRESGGARIGWRVESQSGTKEYVLYRSSTTLGPWMHVRTVPADSSQWDYTVVDEGVSESIYELREVEFQGDTLVLGQTELRDAFQIPFDAVPTVELADSLRQNYWGSHSATHLQPDNIQPIYDITYVLPVDPTGAWNTAIQPLVADRLTRGFLVNTVTMDQVGNTRTGLHSYIQQAFRYGLRGVTLCASDEDARSWNKYPWVNGWVQPSWAAHPEWALIPMWDWADPIGIQLQSISWFRPGMTSDMPYGDVTGDSIPEIPVTRIPAMTSAGLSVAVAKILAYERQDLSHGSYIIADQGRSFNGSSGAWATAMADSFAAMLPASLQKIRLHDTDALPLTHAQALSQFLSACAGSRVIGATFTGTVFNRNKFHWLNRTDGDSWSSLGNGQFLTAIAAPTCELAGTDRRVDPSFGPGLPATSFNSYPNQGPAWIWASNNGSHQGANADLGNSFFRYAYQVGCWSAAEAARAAVYDAAQQWYQKHQALGTEILGDVCSPFPGQVLRTTGVTGDAQPEYTLVARRTIHRSLIEYQWSAPAGHNIVVELFDLSGRACSSRQSFVGTGNPQRSDLRTDRLLPGMYFLQLRGNGHALTQKCIILR